MLTRLLTRSDVEYLLEPAALLSALEEAFVAYETKREVKAMRIPVALPPSMAPAGASGMLLAPGTIPGVPAYSVKVHAKVPGGDPAIRGVLVLHRYEDGAPLAVMDSTHLTAMRTALAGALGARVLASAGSKTLLLVGAGAQGRAQLRAHVLAVPTIQRVLVYDIASAAAERLAIEASAMGLAAKISRTLDDALAEADIAVLSTWSTEPFVHARHMHAGLHVTTLGPDQPGKVEVAAEALRQARVFVDDADIALSMGAVGNAGLGRDAITAELGAVLAGAQSGRLDENDVTIFGSVGLAFQDLAAGWLALCLSERLGVGQTIDWLA